MALYTCSFSGQKHWCCLPLSYTPYPVSRKHIEMTFRTYPKSHHLQLPPWTQPLSSPVWFTAINSLGSPCFYFRPLQSTLNIAAYAQNPATFHLEYKSESYSSCETLLYILCPAFLSSAHCAPVTMTSLLFFKHTSCIPTLGPEMAVLTVWNTHPPGTCMPNSATFCSTITSVGLLWHIIKDQQLHPCSPNPSISDPALSFFFFLLSTFIFQQLCCLLTRFTVCFLAPL